MKMLKLLFFAGFFIFQLTGIFADEGQDTNILLFYQKSDFKSLLAREFQSMAPEGYRVTLAGDFSDIKKADFEAYGVVVILNTGVARHMNNKAKKRVMSSPGTRFIVVTTYGDPGTSRDEFLQNGEVDAITTASLEDAGQIRQLAATLWEKIERDSP